MHANSLKSSLILAGVQGLEAKAIEDELHFTRGSFPFRYLGIPISASRLRGSDYAPLIERIAEMIKAWTSFNLSYAGRLELIQSVVQGVSCYWLSIFLIPAIVIEIALRGYVVLFYGVLRLPGSLGGKSACLRRRVDWAYVTFEHGIELFWPRHFGIYTQKKIRYGSMNSSYVDALFGTRIHLVTPRLSSKT